MKTKNQTGHTLLELAATSAANEDGISPANSRDVAEDARKPAQKQAQKSQQAQKQAWSPYEVWRTRVKTTADLPSK